MLIMDFLLSSRVLVALLSLSTFTFPCIC